MSQRVVRSGENFKTERDFYCKLQSYEQLFYIAEEEMLGMV